MIVSIKSLISSLISVIDASPLMTFNKFIDLNNEEIVLKLRLLPVYKEVEKVVRNNQKLAEKKLQIGAAQILDQLYTDNLMEQGNVEGAATIQKKNLETQKLIEYNNN